MSKFLLLSFFTALFCLPPQYNVQKIWLFSKIQYLGNVPVDANGKQLKGYSNVLICYLKISKKQLSPIWQTAYFNGGRYSVNVLSVNLDSVVVGKRKNTQTVIVVKASPDSKLVQLILTAQENFKNYKTQGFILEGVFNKKTVHLRSSEPVIELSPVLSE